MSDHDPQAPAAAEPDLALVLTERDRAIHALQHALFLVGSLRGLVSRAFKEGFAAGSPAGREALWLGDWLGSAAKAELEQLLARRPPAAEPDA